jgi:hypothetical protein
MLCLTERSIDSLLLCKAEILIDFEDVVAQAV